MKQRKLGTQGLEVAEIGYGAMGTAVGYGPSDDQESISAIRRAKDLGVTMFDTAEMYGWGEGEKLLGAAVESFRGEISVATKFGFESPTWAFNSKPEHIREVVENSLRNLGTDSIDLLYQHRVDPEVPIEDVVRTMKEFVDAGKVKYIGLCEVDEETLRRAHAIHPISVVQSEYSIFVREPEPLFPVLEELGIGFVAYSPLARGFLTGSAKPRSEYDEYDFRQNVGWWAPENFDQNVAIVDELTKIADEKGITVSQLSLAWLLAQKDYIVPIPGSRNPRRVEENTAAAEVVLSAADLARIDQIAPNGGIGNRNG